MNALKVGPAGSEAQAGNQREGPAHASLPNNLLIIADKRAHATTSCDIQRALQAQVFSREAQARDCRRRVTWLAG